MRDARGLWLGSGDHLEGMSSSRATAVPGGVISAAGIALPVTGATRKNGCVTVSS